MPKKAACPKLRYPANPSDQVPAFGKDDVKIDHEKKGDKIAGGVASGKKAKKKEE